MKDKIYTTDQVMNKEMGFNMTMNKYVSKDGREAVMHNNKTHVTTADGREWTLASSIVTVASAAIPSTITEPKLVVKPAAPSLNIKK